MSFGITAKFGEWTSRHFTRASRVAAHARPKTGALPGELARHRLDWLGVLLIKIPKSFGSGIW